MEDKGYISSHLEDAPADAGGLPRRMYAVTPFGARVLEAWTRVTGHLLEAFAR
jgi:DNA-binding PadR family transcriptional regulator